MVGQLGRGLRYRLNKRNSATVSWARDSLGTGIWGQSRLATSVLSVTLATSGSLVTRRIVGLLANKLADGEHRRGLTLRLASS